MYNFITVLKCIATLLITNSHLAGVFPTDIFSHGGMLGNIIFFAASGFCLTNLGEAGFFKWYGKRIIRIYPVVWIVTGVYLILGFFDPTVHSLFYYMIFPLNNTYHFIVSIMLLYVPYYFVVRWIQNSRAEQSRAEQSRAEQSRARLRMVIITTYLLHIGVYIFLFDKSTYHIDNVLQPMIRFLFFESMLFGIYIQQNKEKIINKGTGLKKWAALCAFTVLYPGTKLFCLKVPDGSYLQILNQFTIMAVMIQMFYCFGGIADKLDKIPEFGKKLIVWIGSMTLEIYIVQSILIAKLKDVVFPVNILLIIIAILVSAWLVKLIVDSIIKKIRT